MKSLLTAVLLYCCLCLSSWAQTPQPPEVGAKSYFLLDMTTHKVLAERNADQPADPASLTKLMTAYVVFTALRDKQLTLEQTVPVSTRAWEERKGGGSLMFIDTTMSPKVDELLRGMIVQSGNDASVALAEAVGGTLEQFVDMMNRQAQAFGLKNTTFKNATGLTEAGHQSTARELATIASRIITDFPDFYAYYSVREYRYNNINQANRNLLLARDPTVDGMKTGFTDAAGYCLIASSARSFPNLGTKRRLLSVVLNTRSMEARASESQKLLNWGFQAFDAVRLFEDGQVATFAEVWKGTKDVVRLGAASGVYANLPKGEAGQWKAVVERTDPLVAPLAKGQTVGTIKVTTNSGTPVMELPLAVLEPVELSGFFGRTWDSLRLWIK
jgi:serine-type D-Ala-D-Ala carboxypeptidase (penicillin-binding protein 5/6)